jgi:hypothetical protein
MSFKRFKRRGPRRKERQHQPGRPTISGRNLNVTNVSSSTSMGPPTSRRCGYDTTSHPPRAISTPTIPVANGRHPRRLHHNRNRSACLPRAVIHLYHTIPSNHTYHHHAPSMATLTSTADTAATPKRGLGWPPMLVEATAGLVAGALSTLVVHPLDLVKTRLQSMSLPSLPLQKRN